MQRAKDSCQKMGITGTFLMIATDSSYNVFAVVLVYVCVCRLMWPIVSKAHCMAVVAGHHSWQCTHVCC